MKFALSNSMFLHLARLRYRMLYRQNFARLQLMRHAATDDGYSFRPFDETSSIFIHIPKCAGVSLSRALYGGLAGGHTTLNEYLLIFEPSRIESYFKFTIARNPWDRLVSAYFFLQGGGFGEADRRWFNEELGGFDGFADFVRRWLNRDNIWKWHHFRPQWHYILDSSERVSLDFIGLLENIDSDFDYIQSRIGRTCHIPRANASAHSGFVDYYCEETIEIVRDVYREDIDLLGYSFDNSALPDQLARRHSGI